VAATSEAQHTPMPAPAPTPGGTRSVPATSEAQATPMPAPASTADGTRSVPATSNGGVRGNALDGLAPPRSEVPERAVARPQADLSGGEASNGGAALERPAAPDGATSGTVSAVAAHHHGEPGPLDLDTIRKLWPELAKKVDKRVALTLTQVEPIDLEGADVLVIAVKPGYNSTFADVDSPEAQSKIAQALQRLVHRPIRIKYIRRVVDEHGESGARRNEARRVDSLSQDPLVQRVLELFEARPVQMDYGESDPSPDD
jgi:DNA polymerase III subunit gamma/tau